MTRKTNRATSKIKWAFLFLAAVGVGTAQADKAAQAAKAVLASGTQKSVVMISVDGFRPDFYLDEKFEMPTVRNLLRAGAHATDAVPVFPSVTYPNHVSLITGAAPSVHGVLSNTVFTWEKGPEPGWIWEADKVKVPTLLDVVHAKGMVSSSVRWPVTLFGKATYNVPEIFSMRGYYEGDNYELTLKYTDEKLRDELKENIAQKGYADDEEMDHWVSAVSNHILKNKKPAFMAIHLANVDHIAHGEGRDSALVRAAVKDADNNIAKILDGLDLAKTCVFIVGDHGFYDVSQKILPNVLFLKKGWIEAEGGTVKSWRVIAQSSGGQAGIFLKDKSLKNQVRALLNENRDLGYRIIEKSELEALGAYPEADFAVTANDGFTMSGDVRGEPVQSSGTLRGQHGHLPDDPKLHTGFVASGCGILPGQALGVISNLEIAPTAAKILNVDLADAKKSPLPIRFAE